jgi:surface antigen
LPTLGTVEVELKDGYVVSARDDSGTPWSSDAIVDFEVNDEGYLVYARYADGMVWVADPSPEITDVVHGLRAELEAPVKVAPPQLKTVATPQPATRKAKTVKAATPVDLGPEPTAAKLKIVKARKNKRSRSPRNTMVRATNKAYFGSRSAAQRLASAAPPLGQSSYPRVASHLLVLGAVLTPMSFTVASAHTSPIQQGRITIPLSLDAAKTEVATADELRAVAAAEAVTAPSPAAPAAVATETPKAAPAPATRPFPQAQPAASSGGHFPWGWCTWYVSTKRYVPWMGNAIEWYSNASSMGFPEGQTPKVGAIMVTRESWWGHVAYVESVDGNGGFTVSEMNYKGFGIVSQRHFNSNPSVLVGFIY